MIKRIILTVCFVMLFITQAWAIVVNVQYTSEFDDLFETGGVWENLLKEDVCDDLETLVIYLVPLKESDSL